MPDPVRIARDYNRTLPAPVRWLHVAWSATLGPTWTWCAAPNRRHWVLPMLFAALAFVLLRRFDGPLADALASVSLGGDVRRELEALGQFGAVTSLVLTGAVVALLDPTRRARLWDLAAAAAASAVVLLGAKMLIGRPRPRFDDPDVFLGPFGAYPLGAGEGVHHAWELWAGISSDLWSMPSSHTAAAVVLAVFLVALYPALRPLTIILVVLVAFSRLIFGAHYLTDVIVGGAMGYVVAHPIVHSARVSRRLTRRDSR